jgi:hypothetical protein
MANGVDGELEELGRNLDFDLRRIVQQRDSAARLLEELPRCLKPQDVVEVGGPGQRAWELAGVWHMQAMRPYEALQIFWGLYQHMLAAQKEGRRARKGMPLVWMSDCFQSLGCPLHEKRYRMLTLCEDAIRGEGRIPPDSTGSYHRLVWTRLPEQEFQRYATLFFDLAKAHPAAAMFPEALLQRVDDDWLTVIPSAAEAFLYFASDGYVSWLLEQLGHSRGKALEFLAEYLMSCMPGCRTTRRRQTRSTDHDIVCSMEGFEVDFRSEFGRYFVCECKDWNEPANFTTMAKFCRVLDSFKARFGILFSKSGITGDNDTTDAAREQLKIFQDRGIVVVVLSLKDLEAVAKGRNLISLLRKRYEAVRLDIRETDSRKSSRRSKGSRKRSRSVRTSVGSSRTKGSAEE